MKHFAETTCSLLMQVLECFNQHDVVEVPTMLGEIGRGGNGTVYKCHIKNYKDSKQLVCKKEHKVCSSSMVFSTTMATCYKMVPQLSGHCTD